MPSSFSPTCQGANARAVHLCPPVHRGTRCDVSHGASINASATSRLPIRSPLLERAQAMPAAREGAKGFVIKEFNAHEAWPGATPPATEDDRRHAARGCRAQQTKPAG